MSFEFSGPRAKTPAKGAFVAGSIYIPSCQSGRTPIANYRFQGEFIGECADGFMVRPSERSDWLGTATDDKGTIFCRPLEAA